MRFRELGASVRRQWIIAVLGLALTGVAGYVALQLVPVSHRASAHVLLLPGQSTIPEEGNPFLHLGGIHPMRDILSRSVMADEVSEHLLQGTTDTSYEVVPDGASAAPAVVATVQGPASTQTLRTLDEVLAQVQVSLTTVQDELGIPEVAQISDMVLSVDEQTELVRSSTVRAVVAAIVLGMVLTFVLTIWVDSIRVGRRTGHEDEDPPAPPARVREPL